MQRQYLTNEIRFKIDQKRVLQDFIILRFADEKKLLYTDDSPLDLLKHRLDGLLAVAYLHGKQFYALFDRRQGDEFSLSKKLEPLLSELDPGGRIVFQPVFKFENCTDKNGIDNRHLLQLLLNALPNLVLASDGEPTFRNAIGQLFYLTQSKPNAKTGSVKQYQTLKIKVEAFDFPRLCLTWEVKTFTNLAFQKATSAAGKTWNDLQLFLLDDRTRTMRRIRWAEKPQHERHLLFLPAQFLNQRASIPMLDFSSRADFEKSKCGVLDQLLRQTERHLSAYFLEKMAFAPPDFDCEKYDYQGFDAQSSREVQTHLEEFYRQRQVVLVDEVRSGASEKLATRTLELLRESPLLLENPSVEIAPALVPSAVNLRVVESQKFYETHGLPDPHHAAPSDFLVQHLSIRETEISAPAVKNILKEACLKLDVLQNRISFFDWQRAGEWHFLTRENAAKDKPVFALLTVLPDGEMRFEHRAAADLAAGSERLRRLAGHFPTDKSAADVEGLVASPDEQVNLIFKTKRRVLPNFRHIGGELRRAEAMHIFSKTELVGLLDEFLAANPQFLKDEKVAKFSEKLRTAPAAEIQKSSLREWMTGNERGKTTRKLTDAFKKRFIARLDERTGQAVDVYFRDGQNKSLFPLNINFHGSDSMAFYYVGEPCGGGKSLQEKMATACIVRRVKPAVSGGRIVFDQLLDSLNVDFVKQGDLTVLPFPFKYLREYWARVKNAV